MQLVVEDGGLVPVPTVLAYDERDPYAVTATFQIGEGAVNWVFGRDLLSDGLTHHAGDGDVMVWPGWDDETGDIVYLSLLSPDGVAMLRGPKSVIEPFVTRSYEIVGFGAESTCIDIDSDLAELLA